MEEIGFWSYPGLRFSPNSVYFRLWLYGAQLVHFARVRTPTPYSAHSSNSSREMLVLVPQQQQLTNCWNTAVKDCVGPACPARWGESCVDSLAIVWLAGTLKDLSGSLTKVYSPTPHVTLVRSGKA